MRVREAKLEALKETPKRNSQQIHAGGSIIIGEASRGQQQSSCLNEKP